jgi:hypothetical protein
VEQPERWYGWQTLAADGGAVFLFLSSLALLDGGDDGASTVVAWTSLGVYVLGGPVVHGFHGHAGKAAGSLGIRVGAPLVGGILGAGILSGCKKHESDDLCELGGAAWGILLGSAAAMALDAAVLAHEFAPTKPATVGLRWQPAVGFSRNAAWMGVAGAL